MSFFKKGALRITFAIERCQGAASVLSRVLRIMFAIGRYQSAVKGCCSGCSGSCLPVSGVPDHVCCWAVSGRGAVQGCCSECSGSCLPAVSAVLFRVLSRVLRIMFAIGRCQGAVQGAVQWCCWGVLSKVLWCCRGCCPAVQGAPDHVCYWAVSGCCWGCCWGCCPGAVQGAIQGAPDHVIGRCQSAVVNATWTIGQPMLSPVEGPPSGPRFMQLSQSVEWKFSRGNEVADDVSVQTYRDIYAVVLDQLSQLDIGANEMEGLLFMCNRTEVLGVLTTYPSHLLPESKDNGQPIAVKVDTVVRVAGATCRHGLLFQTYKGFLSGSFVSPSEADAEETALRANVGFTRATRSMTMLSPKDIRLPWVGRRLTWPLSSTRYYNLLPGCRQYSSVWSHAYPSW